MQILAKITFFCSGDQSSQLELGWRKIARLWLNVLMYVTHSLKKSNTKSFTGRSIEHFYYFLGFKIVKWKMNTWCVKHGYYLISPPSAIYMNHFWQPNSTPSNVRRRPQPPSPSNIQQVINSLSCACFSISECRGGCVLFLHSGLRLQWALLSQQILAPCLLELGKPLLCVCFRSL